MQTTLGSVYSSTEYSHLVTYMLELVRGPYTQAHFYSRASCYGNPHCEVVFKLLALHVYLPLMLISPNARANRLICVSPGLILPHSTMPT